MGRVCYVPSLYVPSLYGPSLLCAEFVMGRVCYVPSWPDTFVTIPGYENKFRALSNHVPNGK